MKLSDYVFQMLAERSVRHVFMVVGGANAHLADSLARTEGLTYVCAQHEQAAAMAAEGYARASGRLGAVLTTQGPSATNALTGVAGAWCDSIPMIVISGQVPSNMVTDGRTIRQLGVQQLNIIEIVRSVTKYATSVTDPSTIRFHLEKALHEARSGRPGPVWIDIPTEIQRAEIDPGKLKGFDATTAPFPDDLSPQTGIHPQIRQVIDLLKAASRPVIIAGHGIRLADAVLIFRDLLPIVRIPVITTWNGIDLIDHRDPLYVGSAGVMGQRGANYAVANADLIISIGSRLDTRQVGNSPELYARAAKKVAVDIDRHELDKGLIAIDVPIQGDAGWFLNEFKHWVKGEVLPDIASWRQQCQAWREKYPVVEDRCFAISRGVNSYVFVQTLSQLLSDGDIVVTDMGTSFTCTMQTFAAKGGRQRLFTNSGLASMGFGLPATIGASFADQGAQVIGIYGDGGFQMNIQELQTVVHHRLPVKLFILNSGNYLTIQHTQQDFFEGRYVGSHPASGYSAPSFTAIAKAYGIKDFLIESQLHLEAAISEVLGTSGSVLCEVMIPPDQALVPLSKVDKSRGYAGAPLERMYPFLPEEEHRSNMLIDPV